MTLTDMRKDIEILVFKNNKIYILTKILNAFNNAYPNLGLKICMHDLDGNQVMKLHPLSPRSEMLPHSSVFR